MAPLPATASKHLSPHWGERLTTPTPAQSPHSESTQRCYPQLSKRTTTPLLVHRTQLSSFVSHRDPTAPTRTSQPSASVKRSGFHLEFLPPWVKEIAPSPKLLRSVLPILGGEITKFTTTSRPPTRCPAPPPFYFGEEVGELAGGHLRRGASAFLLRAVGRVRVYEPHDPQEKTTSLQRPLGEGRGGGCQAALEKRLAVTEQGRSSSTCRVKSCARRTTDSPCARSTRGRGSMGMT